MEAIRNLVLQPEEEQKIRVALQAIFDNPKNKIVHTFSDIETAMSAMCQGRNIFDPFGRLKVTQ